MPIGYLGHNDVEKPILTAHYAYDGIEKINDRNFSAINSDYLPFGKVHMAYWR
jgi:hypothetical protein